MGKHVVDTHALIWFLEDNSRLGANALSVLENPQSELVLPAIVLAEACWVVERGRTSIPSAVAMLTAIDADPRVTIIPMDRQTIGKTLQLRVISEMHDRQIIATAMQLMDEGHAVELLSCDSEMQSAALVPIVW